MNDGPALSQSYNMYYKKKLFVQFVCYIYHMGFIPAGDSTEISPEG